jgi:hypothetical protein
VGNYGYFDRLFHLGFYERAMCATGLEITCHFRKTQHAAEGWDF